VAQNLHSVLIGHGFDVSGCVNICNNIYMWTDNPHIFYDMPFPARFKVLLSVLLNIQVFWDDTLSHWTLSKEFNAFIFSVKQSKNDTWWSA